MRFLRQLRRGQIHTVKHTGTGAEARDRVYQPKLGRGRHTTREVEIFEICGGRLADTPGFASLEAQKLCRIPKDDIQHTFPEFAPYFGQCRFTGCSHRSETGCAVREAVDSGTISKTRYASYLAMYEEASARKEWEK